MSKLAPREQRLERAELLRKERSLLADLIKSGNAEGSHYTRFQSVDDELTQLDRINRGEFDVMYFALEYFSDDGNPDNDENLIPAGVNYENSAEFHHELCGLLNDIASGKQRDHVAWACPRQHAKTAYLSNIFLTHQVVYRHQTYIVLVSETTDVAGDFLSWSKYQLKHNSKLRADFGELLHVRANMNTLDNKYEYITSTNVKVEAKGLGTQMRGLRHGASRPGLFILDDIESDESTSTPEQIAKAKRWFTESMLPALAKDGICVYLGTILCYDSLLDSVIRERKDFQSRKYAAIIEWAERDDLWTKWRALYREDTPSARMNAYNFYEENKDEMVRGSKLLWDSYYDYIDFIEILENSGPKAFNQEYQNNPTDEERQIFKPEQMTYYTEFDMRSKNFEYYAGIDFAMGKERGDFSTIVTLAKNTNTGNTFVVDVFEERVHPDKFLEAIIKHVMKYQYEAIAVEAQMAQEWFADTLRKRLAERGYPSHTRLKYIKHRTRKALRIEALLPDVQAGKIRFSKQHVNLLEQMQYYPMVKHDDILDALEMAYRTSKGKGQGTVSVAQSGARRW